MRDSAPPSRASAWHLAEHAAFLLTAWLFWWSALHAAPRRRPQALLAVVLTLMHTGLLGALLAFGRTPFYGAERGGLAIAWRRLERATPPETTERRLRCEE